MKTLRIATVPTIGFPLALTLTYHAQETVSLSLGPKWRHNYMMGLSFASGSPATMVTFTDVGGGQYSFTWSGSAWVRASTSYFLDATLAQSGSTWTLTLADNTQYTFDDQGHLTGRWWSRTGTPPR